MNKIRLLKASPFSTPISTKLYELYPNLINEPYEIQYSAHIETRYAWSDFWKQHLEDTRNFEVKEVLSTVEPLQKKWAHENGIKFSERNWTQDIVKAQVLDFNPHIFFPLDYGHLHSEILSALKKLLPGMKIICYDGIALNDPIRFQDCDIMLSCVDFIVDYYREAGFKSYLFRPGFEGSILEEVNEGSNLYPVTFVGGISVGPNTHNKRFRLLSYLSKFLPLDLWAHIPSYTEYIISRLVYLKRRQYVDALIEPFSQIQELIHLRRINHGAVFGLDMYQVLADSKITINSHIDIARNQAGNMRLYEATGMGACLVTDWKDNLADIFEDDYEVVTFKTSEECVEKVNYLIDNDSVRKQIALQGQKKTLEKYNLKQQIDNIAELLLELV